MNEPIRFWRRANLAIMLIGLAACVAGLAMLLVFFEQAHRVAGGEPERRYFNTMAMLAGALLVLAVFCLALMAIRLLILRAASQPRKQEPTEYVDAWAIAGQRFELDDENLEELYDQEDSDDQQGPDEEQDDHNDEPPAR